MISEAYLQFIIISSQTLHLAVTHYPLFPVSVLPLPFVARYSTWEHQSRLDQTPSFQQSGQTHQL